MSQLTPAQSSATNGPLLALFKSGQKKEYAKGELIIRGDDRPPDEIYYLDSGFVKVYSINNRGESYVQIIYGHGDIFPMRWIADKATHGLYSEALSPTVVYGISNAAFQEAISTSLGIANQALYQLVHQFGIYIDRLDNLQYKYVQERVIYRLLLLARRFGKAQPDGSCVIEAPISQQLIANSVNASRENVSRELERLHRKGLLGYVDKQISITDPVALRKLLPGQLSFDD